MGHPTIYPTVLTLFNLEKCWSGYTIFQAQEVGAVLMDMNGREVNVGKGVLGMSNKVFPGGGRALLAYGYLTQAYRLSSGAFMERSCAPMH